MIIQLINNISWASLLVSESQAWQQETPRLQKKITQQKIKSDENKLKLGQFCEGGHIYFSPRKQKICGSC